MWVRLSAVVLHKDDLAGYLRIISVGRFCLDLTLLLSTLLIPEPKTNGLGASSQSGSHLGGASSIFGDCPVS